MRVQLFALIASVAGCGSSDSDTHPCNVPCPLYPSVDVEVTTAAGSPLDGVALTNLVAPATGGVQTAWARCNATSSGARCLVAAGGAGSYSFDVVAPGYQPVHVDVSVPARSGPVGCCGDDFVQQQLQVGLTPM